MMLNCFKIPLHFLIFPLFDLILANFQIFELRLNSRFYTVILKIINFDYRALSKFMSWSYHDHLYHFS